MRRQSMEATQNFLDLFIINPKPFKLKGRTYAILAMHLPHPYNKNATKAVITKDGWECEVTFTILKECLLPAVVSLNKASPKLFTPDTALYQAIEDWKQAQMEDSNSSIKKTIVFKLPFQAVPNFSTTLHPKGGLINGAINRLPNNAGAMRQLLLIFKEKSNNKRATGLQHQGDNALPVRCSGFHFLQKV